MRVSKTVKAIICNNVNAYENGKGEHTLCNNVNATHKVTHRVNKAALYNLYLPKFCEVISSEIL